MSFSNINFKDFKIFDGLFPLIPKSGGNLRFYFYKGKNKKPFL